MADSVFRAWEGAIRAYRSISGRFWGLPAALLTELRAAECAAPSGTGRYQGRPPRESASRSRRKRRTARAFLRQLGG